MKPQPVFLRNGTVASVIGTVENLGPFGLHGKIATGEDSVWQMNGSWREDGAEHPLDIVTIITPCGKVVKLKDIKK